ncbi:MarR family winged helix-turn-helix transcriptional regulator [Polymorphobacter sp. PAMC 29334]|uniref:MarR family winged helix-turn-helix transcriptional regulator n=2 Tax=Sphingosinicellaceae TaxID=2820280 RepID=UPI001D00AA16|nr:MarR family transcriptional regulator [Polymorphobacter sp. PAMC 29334]
MSDDLESPVDLGALGNFAGYHLRRAAVAFAANFANAMQTTKIRQVQFGIMSVIAANPGMNQGTVGRALGIQRANMVTLINELVDRDLVARNGSVGDRRVVSLSLTTAGEAALADCITHIVPHEEAMLAHLDAHEREQLIVLLDRIAAVGA